MQACHQSGKHGTQRLRLQQTDWCWEKLSMKMRAQQESPPHTITAVKDHAALLHRPKMKGLLSEPVLRLLGAPDLSKVPSHFMPSRQMWVCAPLFGPFLMVFYWIFKGNLKRLFVFVRVCVEDVPRVTCTVLWDARVPVASALVALASRSMLQIWSSLSGCMWNANIFIRHSRKQMLE